MVSASTEKHKRRIRRAANGLMKIPGCGCVLAVVAIPVVFFTCWLWSREEENEREQRIEEAERTKEEEALYQFPPPVSQRERPLSIAVRKEEMEAGTVMRRRTRHQLGTGFFRLPWELREQIYKDYFEFDEEILVVLRDWNVLTAYVARQGDVAKLKLLRRADMLNFLITCRKIYIEGISLLYSLPTFVFIDPPSFLAFSHHILPLRFNAIRNVRMDFLNHPDEHNLGISGSGLSEHQPMNEICLNMRLTYRDLYRSDISNFYNDPSSKFSSPKSGNGFRSSDGLEFRRKRNDQTFWTATCRVLSKMESLRSLDIVIRKVMFDADRKITRPLEHARFRHLKHFKLEVVTGPGSERARRSGVNEWVVEEWKEVVNEDGRSFGWDNDPETVRRAETWRDNKAALDRLQEDLGSQTEIGHHMD